VPPEALPTAAEAASAKMEERHEAMMEKRRKRYQELRERAAEVGLELPETPPWEASGMTPPKMPTPPVRPAPPDRPAMGRAPKADERDAMREARYQAMRARAAEIGVELPETPPWKLMSPEERQAHREAMRSMTPEQRAAMREQHWAEMRERAAEKGLELPEAPPWKLMQERREEMRAKWEAYRETVEQMTDEQREAAAAIYGRGPATAGRDASPQMPMQPRSLPGAGAMPAMPQQMPHPPMMPGHGKGAPGPWQMGKQPMMQMPPAAPAGPRGGW
jgi:hypothetical protein